MNLPNSEDLQQPDANLRNCLPSLNRLYSDIVDLSVVETVERHLWISLVSPFPIVNDRITLGMQDRSSPSWNPSVETDKVMRWKTDLHGTVACGDNRNNFESFQSLDRNNSHGRLIRWREFSSAETRDIEKWIHNTPRNAFWRKRSREGCFCQTPPDKLCFPLWFRTTKFEPVMPDGPENEAPLYQCCVMIQAEGERERRDSGMWFLLDSDRIRPMTWVRDRSQWGLVLTQY